MYAWTPCQTDAGSTLGATLFFIRPTWWPPNHLHLHLHPRVHVECVRVYHDDDVCNHKSRAPRCCLVSDVCCLTCRPRPPPSFRARRWCTSRSCPLAAAESSSKTRGRYGPTILVPPYHRTTVPPYPLTTMPPYHRTTVPPYHRTTLSYHHRTTVRHVRAI